MTRRCGFLGRPEVRDERPRPPVWVRRRVSSDECPKSLITGRSMAWMELFWFWKTFGGVDLMSLAARDVDALIVLETEWRKEAHDVG
ncbi:MAG: hypothetical protein FJW40_08760 [Acidobacteria bacterium]|nr:hypothetical protein [Acidobacteriota bacterium]